MERGLSACMSYDPSPHCKWPLEESLLFGDTRFTVRRGTRDTSLKRITVFECSDHRDECSIKRVAIIIDTCRIDI
jgi:hypothetical protein